VTTCDALTGVDTADQPAYTRASAVRDEEAAGLNSATLDSDVAECRSAVAGVDDHEGAPGPLG
jgi:hypothetical protein